MTLPRNGKVGTPGDRDLNAAPRSPYTFPLPTFRFRPNMKPRQAVRLRSAKNLGAEMRLVWCGVLLVSAGLAGTPGRARQDGPAKATGEVVVTDVDGKETRLTGAKLTTGTRRLLWLADAKGVTPDEKLGPLAVEVREANSTTFQKGVLTLVPAGSLESARYDYEKLSVSLSVKGLKDPLTGTLQYAKINNLGLTGTWEGKAATFTAGVLGKGAVKTINFPEAKAVVPPKGGGANWAVQIVHPAAANPTVKARNLKLLYQFMGGTQRLVDAIPVRKGTPIPFDDKLTRFEILANDENTGMAAAEVELGPGTERVIAIPLTTEQDKRTGTLLGLLGEVEAGYKLFPLHTVKSITPLSKKAD